MTRTTYPTNFKNTSMKLEATELRVGNIFWEDYGGYKVVTAINCNRVGDAPNSVSARAINNTVSGQFSCDAIQPVPLTPEILEACGFKKDKDGCFNRNNVLYMVDEIVLQIASGYSPILNAPCRYVHQLQNLIFALLGEELTINL